MAATHKDPESVTTEIDLSGFGTDEIPSSEIGLSNLDELDDIDTGLSHPSTEVSVTAEIDLSDIVGEEDLGAPVHAMNNVPPETDIYLGESSGETSLEELLAGAGSELDEIEVVTDDDDDLPASLTTEAPRRDVTIGFPVVLSGSPGPTDTVDLPNRTHNLPDRSGEEEQFGTLEEMILSASVYDDDLVDLPASVPQPNLVSRPPMAHPQGPAGQAQGRISIGPSPLLNAKPALLLDVTPRSLGVATAGGFCDVILERNSAIPVEQSRVFGTSADYQAEVSINIFQGESRRTKENTKLGEVQLTNIRPAPRGEIKIRVIFEIDTDGILGVSAINEDTKEKQSTRIVLSGGMDEDKIEELVKKYADT